jgi:hypothetical protein
VKIINQQILRVRRTHASTQLIAQSSIVRHWHHHDAIGPRPKLERVNAGQHSNEQWWPNKVVTHSVDGRTDGDEGDEAAS